MRDPLVKTHFDTQFEVLMKRLRFSFMHSTKKSKKV